jgi:lambda repressor-like predicted transcriptional regulator
MLIGHVPATKYSKVSKNGLKLLNFSKKNVILGLFFTEIFNCKVIKVQNSDEFTPKIFWPEKYISSDQKPKIGQQFLFPAEFWPFEKFLILTFWSVFSKILTLEVAGEPKFRAFCPKIFWPEKYIFCVRKPKII